MPVAWMSSRRSSSSARRRVRDVAIVAGGLLVGLAVPGALDAVREQDAASRPAPAAAEVGIGESDGTAPAGEAVLAGDPAATPLEAVNGFLEAEVAGDHDRSFLLLDEGGRARYRTPARWAAAHADFFPVRGFALGEVTDGDGAAEVSSVVDFVPGLDEIVGLVPAQADVHWPTTSEAGGWLVDFDAAVVEPHLLADGDALAAAERWLTDVHACRPPAQYEGGLVGSGVARSAELCGAPTPPRAADTVRLLDPVEGAALVSAFGDATWARAVDVAGPVPMTVVLGPVDDRWLVVGALPSR